MAQVDAQTHAVAGPDRPPATAVREALDAARISRFGFWTVTIAATAITYLLVSFGLFPDAGPVQIGLFVGAIAGLVATSLLQAVTSAAGMLLVAAPVYPPWYAALTQRSLSVSELALLVILAGAGAAAIWLVKRAMRGYSGGVLLISLLLMLWVVLSMWLTTAGVDLGHGGPQTLVAMLRSPPRPGQYATDDQAYLRMFYLMHQGMPYYEAVRDAWLNSTIWHQLPNGVVSYRLPTLFWIWLLLPADGAMLIPLFLAFASVAVFSAWAIGRELGGNELAPLAALAVAVYYLMGSLSMYITYVDLYAMALLLSGIACFVRAETTGRPAWLYAAVACCTLGSLMRELLIYIPLFALATTLLLPRDRRSRSAMPWTLGIGIFALGYAAHVIAIAGRISPTSTLAVWLRGSLQYLWVALQAGMQFMNGRPWVLTALIMTGIAGGAGLWRFLGLRMTVFFLLCMVLPLASLTVLGNPGSAHTGEMVNYWGLLTVPISLSLIPAAILPGLQTARSLKNSFGARPSGGVLKKKKSSRK